MKIQKEKSYLILPLDLMITTFWDIQSHILFFACKKYMCVCVYV